jgi:hypothetical protein
MPTTWDLIVPSSAPPLAGPVYAQYNVAKTQRVSPRVLAGRTLPTMGGPAVAKPFPPVVPFVLNFFARTTVHVGLQFEGSPRFAGDALKLRLRAKMRMAERYRTCGRTGVSLLRAAKSGCIPRPENDLPGATQEIRSAYRRR